MPKNKDIKKETIEKLKIRVSNLEEEKLNLAKKREILSAEKENFKKNIATLTEEKQQLEDKLKKVETELIRPKLTSTELVSSFKEAMYAMQEVLKTKKGRVDYSIDKFEVDLKANVGANKNKKVIIQTPYLTEKVPAENLSNIRFSFKAVPRLGVDEIEIEKFISVPNLIGRDKNDAIKIVKDAGLTIGDINEVVSPTPSGIVIGQNPEAESMIPPGNVVNIVISKSKYIEMPNIIGLNKNNAIKIIRNSELNIGKTTEKVKGVKKDIVLSQSIPAGTEVIRGSTIDLVISKPEKIKVPDIIGKTKKDAINTIEGVGLKVGEITKKESSKPEFTIIEQNPKPESEVVIETTVDFVIAKAEKVEVPSLIGKIREDAVKEIKETKLELGKIIEEESTKSEGTVIKQNPTKGTSVIVNTTVNLTIAKKRRVTEVIVPDVTDMKVEKAKEIITEAGLKISRIIRRRSRKPSGTVTSQNPKPDTKVPIKTLIKLVVAMTMR